MELEPLDGFVGNIVEIRGIGREGEFAVLGEVPEGGPLAAPEDADRPFPARLGDCLAAPVAGMEVFGGLLLPSQKGHGHHRELLRRPALHQQYVVVPGQSQQQSDVVFQLGYDRAELIRPVAYAEDR